LLLRDGRPVALIPKYFDLLVLLILRRHDAVSKNAIFAEVWSDVVVSDGALAQAVRTLRRTLGDDVREPRFIRTVSRHGYQFVWPNVTEEADDDPVSPATPRVSENAPPAASIVLLVDRLMTATSPEDARDLAEQLHALGTAEALARLTARPGHAPAVAMMRDARWSVPGAGDVPLLRDPEAFAAVMALVRLRLSDVKRTVVRRWASAAETGAIAGGAAGFLGGAALYLAPTSNARPQSSIALAAIGILAGGIGAAGVGAGLVTAEVLARSRAARWPARSSEAPRRSSWGPFSKACSASTSSTSLAAQGRWTAWSSAPPQASATPRRHRIRTAAGWRPHAGAAGSSAQRLSARAAQSAPQRSRCPDGRSLAAWSTRSRARLATRSWCWARSDISSANPGSVR